MALEKESRVDTETKRNQDAFLNNYGKGASVQAAAKAANVHRGTVWRWVKNDTFGFTERYDLAQADFKDNLIELAVTRLNEQPTNTLLLITMLNAYIPEKFRPNTTSTEDVAKDTIKELRTLAQNAFKAVPASEQETTERSPMEQVEEIILRKKGGDGS